MDIQFHYAQVRYQTHFINRMLSRNSLRDSVSTFNNLHIVYNGSSIKQNKNTDKKQKQQTKSNLE